MYIWILLHNLAADPKVMPPRPWGERERGPNLTALLLQRLTADAAQGDSVSTIFPHLTPCTSWLHSFPCACSQFPGQDSAIQPLQVRMLRKRHSCSVSQRFELAQLNLINTCEARTGSGCPRDCILFLLMKSRVRFPGNTTKDNL